MIARPSSDKVGSPPIFCRACAVHGLYGTPRPAEKELDLPVFRHLFATAAILSAAMPAWAAGPLDAYLPKSGTIAGNVVTFAVAPEDEAVSRQFRHAVQDNMDWFKEAVKGNKPGAPLPYDKRMGITQEQYEHLQHLKPAMKTGAAVTIVIDRRADGTVAFSPKEPEAQPLKDVTFPADEKAAVTPYGRLAIFNPINQTDPNSPLGVWTGAEWAQVMPADAAEPSAKIAFGKREADGSGILYFQVAPYGDHKEQSLVVSYKLN
jgi:hypothetical protein